MSPGSPDPWTRRSLNFDWFSRSQAEEFTGQETHATTIIAVQTLGTVGKVVATLAKSVDFP